VADHEKEATKTSENMKKGEVNRTDRKKVKHGHMIKGGGGGVRSVPAVGTPCRYVVCRVKLDYDP
jgi:hypothetical protein